MNVLTIEQQAEELAAHSQESHDSQGIPEPLRRHAPASIPYPDELGPILGPAAQALHEVIQAPLAICSGAVLAASSLAVQGLADIEIDGRRHPSSIIVVAVAEPGDRKSAVDAEANRPAREFELELAETWEADRQKYENELAEWEMLRSRAKKAAEKPGSKSLAAALNEIGLAPRAPLTPKVAVADFTAEGLAKLYSTGRPSMAAVTDEGAMVFGGHSMSKEAESRTAATICKLWDGTGLDRVRVGDGASSLRGIRFAAHLMIQPVVAEQVLSNPVLSGQGLLARTLLAWPASLAGSRTYRPVNLRELPALIRYKARLLELFRRPLPMAAGKHNELDPPALTLQPKAYEFWRTFYGQVEREIAPGGRFAVAKAWASKTPEQCLRIAAVLTLVENPNATTVDAGTLERAGEIALWHLNEAVRLAGSAEASQEVKDAEAVLEWAHSTGRKFLHSAEILRLGPSRVRELSRLKLAMRELEGAGWAYPLEPGYEIDGRARRRAWLITRAEAT
jgi:hypothetical protein